MKFNEVEINLGQIPYADFMLKINGHEIKYVKELNVYSGVDTERVPIVEIKILASKVIGHIKGKTKIRIVDIDTDLKNDKISQDS